MLPHQDLKDTYDEAIWIYVCRTWRDDESDLEAARTHDRFGVTSWPHLFVIDPNDDKILARLGRSVEALKKGLADRKVKANEQAIAPFEKQHARLLELEAELAKNKKVKLQKLQQMAANPYEDIVIRIRCVQYMAEHAPDELVNGAEGLLEAPSDTIRFAVLKALETHERTDLAPLLAKLFAGAGKEVASGNPNVLRGWAAKCMVKSGDASCLPALEAFSNRMNPFNGTSRSVATALGSIASRLKGDEKKRALRALVQGLPEAVAKDDERKRRSSASLVKSIHGALVSGSGRKGLPSPPSTWLEAERDAYINAVRKKLKIEG